MQQPTLQMCRAQHEHHHDVSLSAALPNVRRVAALAALAWAKEAGAAEKREARAERTRLVRESGNVLHLPPRPDDRVLSENPDRGFADPEPAFDD